MARLPGQGGVFGIGAAPCVGADAITAGTVECEVGGERFVVAGDEGLAPCEVGGDLEDVVPALRVQRGLFGVDLDGDAGIAALEASQDGAEVFVEADEAVGDAGVFGELHDALEHGVDEKIVVFDVEVLGLGGHAVFNSVSVPVYGDGCCPQPLGAAPRSSVSCGTST
ncbi:hypothetical protein ABZ923_31320 [Streptomyces sp. NPDC046881]|uniref:hypothetical protein n=1 Tax=Streptomyces sp. NPDC046881 TaxID=3155374 RepID=UPI0033EBC2EE